MPLAKMPQMKSFRVPDIASVNAPLLGDENYAVAALTGCRIARVPAPRSVNANAAISGAGLEYRVEGQGDAGGNWKKPGDDNPRFAV